MAAEKQAGPLDADKLRELASWYREFADRAEDHFADIAVMGGASRS